MQIYFILFLFSATEILFPTFRHPDLELAISLICNVLLNLHL
jgi:hypothetical protein